MAHSYLWFRATRPPFPVISVHQPRGKRHLSFSGSKKKRESQFLGISNCKSKNVIFGSCSYNYSVEVGGLKDLSLARPWSSPSHFGERAQFRTRDRFTSLLTVKDIKGNESGLYR